MTNFVLETEHILAGEQHVQAPAIIPRDPNAAAVLKNSGATILDQQTFDLATAGYDKTGALHLISKSSKPLTISLLNIHAKHDEASEYSSAGDGTFAAYNLLILVNLGDKDVSLGPAEKDPLRLPLDGVTPRITVPARSRVILESVEGFKIDPGHHNLEIDPQAAKCIIALSIGGS